MEQKRDPKNLPRTVYIDDDRWNALQSKVRGRKKTASGWVREKIDEFLKEK